MHTRTHARMHARMHARKHARPHAHTHARTHSTTAHACARAHTHTHTRTCKLNERNVDSRIRLEHTVSEWFYSDAIHPDNCTMDPILAQGSPWRVHLDYLKPNCSVKLGLEIAVLFVKSRRDRYGITCLLYAHVYLRFVSKPTKYK